MIRIPSWAQFSRSTPGKRAIGEDWHRYEKILTINWRMGVQTSVMTPGQMNPNARKYISGAIQVIAGLSLGLLPYLIAWHFFFLDDKLDQGERFLLVLIFAIPTIIGALIFQGLTTAVLYLKKYRLAALSIWLVYPLLFFPLPEGMPFDLLRLSQDRSPVGKYYLRLDRSGEGTRIHSLLLDVAGSDNHDGSVIGGHRCDQPCIALLRSGTLHRVAIPTDEGGGGFKVFRHSRGESCSIAGRNERRRTALEHRVDEIKAEISSLEQAVTHGEDLQNQDIARQELDRARAALRQLNDQYSSILREPRAESLNHGLTRLGYLDECITTAIVDEFPYTIRITYGGDESGPGIAEVHGDRDGEPYLIARFEDGDGGSFGRNPTVAMTVVRLSGRSSDLRIHPHPVPGTGMELSRLSGLIEGGAYIEDWPELAGWIDDVFDRAAARQQSRYQGNGARELALSTPAIESLIRIAPDSPAKLRERFFHQVTTHLHQETIDTLMNMDMAGR